MNPSLRLRRPIWLLLAASGGLCGMPALAGGWQQSISLPATLEYDTNPTLVPTGKTEIWRARLAPAYSLTGAYGVDEYKAGLGLMIERPSDRAVSSARQDPNLSLGWRRQTETGEFGLTAKYDRASTRSSTLEETGSVVRDGTRTTKSLLGNWRSAISERSSLAADAQRTSVGYDSGTLTGYNNLSAGLTYTYAWSARAEPFLRVSASRYEPDSALVSSSNHYTALGGVKIKSSENLEWTAQAGMSRVSGRTSDTGWLGSFVMRYLGERSDYSLDIGRSISPSGQGGFIEADQIKGTWAYAVDPLTRAGLEASVRKSKGATPNTIQQVGGWVSHELSPLWSSRLFYLHKLRQQTGQSDASGNVLGVTLVYSHPDF